MKSILLIVAIFFSSLTVFAQSKTGQWLTVTEIEAVRLIVPLGNGPIFELDSYPEEHTSVSLSGDRGFFGVRAGLFQIQYPEAADVIKSHEPNLRDKDIFGHFFLYEGTFEKAPNNKTSYYRFTDVMAVRMTKKDGNLQKLEFKNSENKLLTILIEKKRFRYNYQYKNRSYSFTNKVGQDEDFMSKLGNLILNPIALLLEGLCI